MALPAGCMQSRDGRHHGHGRTHRSQLIRPEEGRTCTQNAGSWAHCPPAQAPGSCHLDRGLFCPLRSVLEVWDRCRLLKELHVPKALHGAVYNDGWFGMGGRRPPAVAVTPADPLLLSFMSARPPACQCRYRCPQLHARCLFAQLSHTLPTWQHEACSPRRSGHSPPLPPSPPHPIPCLRRRLVPGRDQDCVCGRGSRPRAHARVERPCSGPRREEA